MTEVQQTDEVWLQGRAIVPGIALGIPFLLPYTTEIESVTESGCLSVEDEILRFYQAVSQSQKELAELADKLRSKQFRQEADLVDAHLQMAGDPLLCREIETTIRQTGKRAEIVVEEIVNRLRKRFDEMPDPSFRERFEDVEGVCHRILSVLDTASKRNSEIPIPTQAVLFAKMVTASVAAEVSVHGVEAIVTTHGGSMSHTAIVARARGIPYVTDIEIGKVGSIKHGEAVIVDGSSGVVILRPREETIRRYTGMKNASDEQVMKSRSSVCQETTTKDGVAISLFANVSRVHEVCQLAHFGLDGVGLYRTEYLVLERKRFPSEQEQTDAYTDMVKSAEGRPVVIRVFDFGSDKGWDEVIGVIPTINQGRRAISLLLEHPPLFLAQLRSIIRASVHGKISVLFPMISSIDELDRCLLLLREAWLTVCGEAHPPFPRAGAMIELPALAFRAASLVGKVDFVSVGTNDLMQYALAVDRSNSAPSDHRLPCHPGLVHLLNIVVQEFQNVDIPLCLCGEMASDPLFVPLLVGLGIRQLSITPRLAPDVKRIVHSFTIHDSEELAKSVLAATSVQEIHSHLQSWLSKSQTVDRKTRTERLK